MSITQVCMHSCPRCSSRMTQFQNVAICTRCKFELIVRSHEGESGNSRSKDEK